MSEGHDGNKITAGTGRNEAVASPAAASPAWPSAGSPVWSSMQANSYGQVHVAIIGE
jgi:hypothetical protein